MSVLRRRLFAYHKVGTLHIVRLGWLQVTFEVIPQSTYTDWSA